ncbi:MAG: hypothetical protein ACRDZY_15245, partial [Acidimicrobiales bacterium]
PGRDPEVAPHRASPRRRNRRVQRRDAARSPAPASASPDLWAALRADWDHQASRPTARRSLHGGTAAGPALAGFDTPPDVVAAIGCLGHPDRSCALLADLLVAARHDQLAAHAVLVALIPGLRAVAGRRWAVAQRDGPWRTRDELDADTITTAWHTISVHAGQRHTRPARLIVRPVERRLRTIHDAHRRMTSRILPLSDTTIMPADRDDGTFGTEYTVRSLADAVRSGRLDPTTGTLAYGVAVLGQNVTSSGRRLGLDRRQARRTLMAAYRALGGEAPAPRIETPAAAKPHDSFRQTGVCSPGTGRTPRHPTGGPDRP